MATPTENMRSIIMLLEDTNLEEISRLGRLAGAAALGAAAAMGAPATAQAQPATGVTQQQERSITGDDISGLLAAASRYVAGLPEGGSARRIWQPTVERSARAWDGVKNDPRLVAAVLDQINGNPSEVENWRRAPGVLARLARGEDVGQWNDRMLGRTVAGISDRVRQAPDHARFMDVVGRR